MIANFSIQIVIRVLELEVDEGRLWAGLRVGEGRQRTIHKRLNGANPGALRLPRQNEVLKIDRKRIGERQAPVDLRRMLYVVR
ncbi:hypothetical protein [Bradyrhizobium elkanii]|uniref:hypothetical protein n=1 Tax=Bradyrhizobium elkanii TaxID=29448 RepID=UPI00114C89D1|nr:hypothetical protein [Bradyrhizobium elkanii]